MWWKLMALASLLVGIWIGWAVHQHGRYQLVHGGQTDLYAVLDTRTGEMALKRLTTKQDLEASQGRKLYIVDISGQAYTSTGR